jgi:hypothetical protein
MSSASCLPSLTVSILEKYFPVVRDLRTYLTEILEHQDGNYAFLPDDSDSPTYRDLINTSYVALKFASSTDGRTIRFKAFPPLADMQEVRTCHVFLNLLLTFTDHRQGTRKIVQDERSPECPHGWIPSCWSLLQSLTRRTLKLGAGI